MLAPAWFAFQNEMLVWGGVLCAIVVGSLILSAIIGIWVYRDAESRGMSGVLWLLIVLVVSLVGLVIYLIVRGSHPVRPPGGMPPPR